MDEQTKNAPDNAIEVEAVKPLKGDLSKACFDLAGELPRMMQNWPKMTRMGLGRKLEEHTYRLLDSAVVVSNPSVDQRVKIATLESMSSGSDAVLVYLRLGHKSEAIAPKLYSKLSSQVGLVTNCVYTRQGLPS
jgi:hypothetical protein